MPIFTKESLEALRNRIDLTEVLREYITLNRAGSSYKALCPFHQERTPSFIIHKGDTHYHCFGCGAHGDAIAFLMSHLKLNFNEAVTSLADKFNIPLELSEEKAQGQKIQKKKLKETLSKAAEFYHFFLLYSEKGKEALHYLFKRGFNIDFIRHFQLGYAPAEEGLLLEVMKSLNFDFELLDESGLLNQRGQEFFIDRITIPILDPLGGVVGFSARKFKEETFGGKYINTRETSLFKKTDILFGLSFSRRRIAKTKQVILVEGQLDALRLIYAGLNSTLAVQGTAFGEGHVHILKQCGVHHLFIAFDGDEAGREAALKVGDLLQSEGMEVTVARLKEGKDPDSLLREEGVESFKTVLQKGEDYLRFLIEHTSKNYDLSSPAGKNAHLSSLAQRIKKWKHPVMVYESLKKLSEILQIPEKMLEIEPLKSGEKPYLRKTGRVGLSTIDPDLIIETDLLRWLLLIGESKPGLIEIIRNYLTEDHFRVEKCRSLFLSYFDRMSQKLPRDLLSFALHLQEEDQPFFTKLLEKKVHLEKAESYLMKTISKILEREWMEAREMIAQKLRNPYLSEEETKLLIQEFDQLKKPEVRV